MISTSSGVEQAKFWLDRINELPENNEPFRVLNVCGGHERSIVEFGLRSLLPERIELVPGPGCPVCVCASQDIETAINFAKAGYTVIAYGDILRVPTNKRESLLMAKTDGANIIAIASPLDALTYAQQHLNEKIVFFAAGFETSFAPLAAVITSYQWPSNLLLLLAGKCTWPAVDFLLNEPDQRIHGLIAPGHVAAIMGWQQWQFCVEHYNLPTAVSAFSSDSLLKSLYWILTSPEKKVMNAYPEVVRRRGNLIAQAQLTQAFNLVDGAWRGIGVLAESAFQLREQYRALDAKIIRPDLVVNGDNQHSMPKGCRCRDVILAKCAPTECVLFNRGCTPQQPIGPCMVSDEGACQIWLKQKR